MKYVRIFVAAIAVLVCASLMISGLALVGDNIWLSEISNTFFGLSFQVLKTFLILTLPVVGLIFIIHMLARWLDKNGDI